MEWLKKAWKAYYNFCWKVGLPILIFHVVFWAIACVKEQHFLNEEEWLGGPDEPAQVIEWLLGEKR